MKEKEEKKKERKREREEEEEELNQPSANKREERRIVNSYSLDSLHAITASRSIAPVRNRMDEVEEKMGGGEGRDRWLKTVSDEFPSPFSAENKGRARPGDHRDLRLSSLTVCIRKYGSR